MDEREEHYKRNTQSKSENKSTFYKWGFFISSILLLCFALGFCSAFVTKDETGKTHLTKPWNKPFEKPTKPYFRPTPKNNGYNEKIHGNDEVDFQKKTSNYKINYPSNHFIITNPTTLNELSNRWHVSIGEIIALNPWLKPYYPNQTIKPPIGHVPGEPSTPQNPDTGGGNEVIEVPDGTDLEGFELEVFKLINKERRAHGLSDLKGDYGALNKVSHAKSQDMFENGYFSHNSPVYGSPFDMMKEFGVSYNYAGENIAKDQRTPGEVVAAWMASSGHKANILSKNFTHVGTGFVKGNGHYYWTQMFVGK